MESRTTIQEDDSVSEDSRSMSNYPESEEEDGEHLGTEMGRMSLAESEATDGFHTA